ncbi:MAG: Uncharacterised protein [Hyphomonas sp. TMED17]|nr:MAG: Uncharacterised protein [Hyphomonas sp. TMED17]
MRRCHQRVRLDIIVSMSQHVWCVENKARKDDQEDNNRETILDGIIGVERNRILFNILNFDTGRIVISGNMQCPNVKNDNASDHEWQQIGQREEALQRLVTDRGSAQKPGLNAFPDKRNRPEQADNYVCAVQRHLSPWQHIAKECRGHHQQINDAAKDPQNLSWRLV